MSEENSVLKTRIKEIKIQWDCYKANNKSLNEAELKILKEQAKQYGVILP